MYSKLIYCLTVASTFFILTITATSTVKACTYESTILNNHLNFRITSDENAIYFVQLMHLNNAPSAPYVVKTLYAPPIVPWVQYLDMQQTYQGYSMIIQNRRQTADAAYWINWIDYTHFDNIPPGVYGLDFDGTMGNESISIGYDILDEFGSTRGQLIFCTRTGDVQMPTPTPSPSPTPVPTPTPTPVPLMGNFELPVNYPGRLGLNPAQFKNAFWQKLTAAFDHSFPTGTHKPYTGNSYTPSDCPSGSLGINCYDSHNGTDFSTIGGSEVFSVAKGQIIYMSSHDSDTCTPESTFGCVVIARYPGNTYGLFAHLSKIHVTIGQSITESTQIGVMGNTGCPGCGPHLHFGVLRPEKGVKNNLLNLLMTKKDWLGLLEGIISTDANRAKAFCSYNAPNGTRFNFMDPSGWRGVGPDPWGQPVKKSGCGANSPYLWRYDIESQP